MNLAHHAIDTGKIVPGVVSPLRSWDQSETVDSCTVIVTRANELVAQIHDRMPAILAPNDYEPWIAAAADPEQLRAVLEPYPASAIFA